MLFGTFATGVFAKLLFSDWSFCLCLTFGAIMAATDPVAVVALLNDLGASAGLTMIITGESLFNDGTAMVLFTLFFKLSDELESAEAADYDTWWKIARFFCRMAVGGPLLGALFGGGALVALYALHQRNGSAHSGTTWQFSVTLVTAYLSFFVGEHTHTHTRPPI